MSPWQPTRWTILQGFEDKQDEAAFRGAWEHLFEAYRGVFVGYVGWCLKRMGGSTLARNEAEEVVDQFLAECLEKDWLTRADREKGRFRTFIRRVLAWYTRDWMARRTAKKRMPPEGPPANVEDLAALVGAEEARAIEQEMDKQWVEHVIARALERMRERSPKNALAIECLTESPGADRELLATRLDMRAKQVPVTLFRARQMFAEELWGQVKDTCSTPDDFHAERAAFKPWLERYLDEDTNRSLFDDGMFDEA